MQVPKECLFIIFVVVLSEGRAVDQCGGWGLYSINFEILLANVDFNCVILFYSFQIKILARDFPKTSYTDHIVFLTLSSLPYYMHSG